MSARPSDDPGRCVRPRSCLRPTSPRSTGTPWGRPSRCACRRSSRSTSNSAFGWAAEILRCRRSSRRRRPARRSSASRSSWSTSGSTTTCALRVTRGLVRGHRPGLFGTLTGGSTSVPQWGRFDYVGYEVDVEAPTSRRPGSTSPIRSRSGSPMGSTATTVLPTELPSPAGAPVIVFASLDVDFGFTAAAMEGFATGCPDGPPLGFLGATADGRARHLRRPRRPPHSHCHRRRIGRRVGVRDLHRQRRTGTCRRHPALRHDHRDGLERGHDDRRCFRRARIRSSTWPPAPTRSLVSRRSTRETSPTSAAPEPVVVTPGSTVEVEVVCLNGASHPAWSRRRWNPDQRRNLWS